MAEGVDGLLHEATRPAGKPPLTPEIIERVVEMTLAEPPGETTHWTCRAMAKAGWDQPSQRPADLGGARPAAASGADLQAVERSEVSPPKCRTSSASMSIRPTMRSCSRSTRSRRSRRSTAPSRAADEARPLRDNDPRLQAPRHDDAVRRAQRAGRQGHRPVHEPPSASGIHPLPQQGSTAKCPPASWICI